MMSFEHMLLMNIAWALYVETWVHAKYTTHISIVCKQMRVLTRKLMFDHKESS